MADNSAIEWTDATWNPIRARNKKTGKFGWHCEHATTGCINCYAEGFNKRLGTGFDFKPGHLDNGDIELFLDETMLMQPLRWKRPRRVFVCSMTDLFARFVKDEWIDKIFAIMALCPQHTFQVLTKRAERMRGYCTDLMTPTRLVTAALDLPKGEVFSATWPLPNIWLGVSAERQQEASERIPHLLQTPAAVRFLSAEPLLDEINLKSLWFAETKEWFNAVEGFAENCAARRWIGKLHLVISGGESGPRARQTHLAWHRSLRDQCDGAGTAFFFKQWGEWLPVELATMTRNHSTLRDGMVRVGKKAAGRLLNGVEHNGMPEVSR